MHQFTLLRLIRKNFEDVVTMPKIMYEFSGVILQNTQNNNHGPGRRIRGVHVVTYRRDVVQLLRPKRNIVTRNAKCQRLSSRR